MLQQFHFDWINYILIVMLSPVVALYFYRVLTPKYTFRKTLWITLVFIMGVSVLNRCYEGWELSGEATVAVGFFITESALYLLMTRCIAKDAFGKRLLAYIAWVALLAFGSAAGSLTCSLARTAAGTDSGISERAFYYLEIVFTEVFQAIILIAVSGWVAKRRRTVETGVRWNLFAILLLTQVIAQLLMVAFLTWRKNVLSNALLLGVYTAVCVLADVYMLRVFRSMVKNAELEQSVALLNQQNELERAQYDAVGEQVLVMRQFRHDYINMLSTIGTLVDMGETERIRTVIRDTEGQLEKNAHRAHRQPRCGRRAVQQAAHGRGEGHAHRDRAALAKNASRARHGSDAHFQQPARQCRALL